MCGGGGSTVEAVDPMKEARAQIKVLQQQYEMDERNRIAAEERQAQKDIADRAAWEEALGVQRSNAQSNIGRQFSQAGLDAADYEDRIAAALDLAQSGIGYEAGATPMFGSDIGTNLIGDLRNEQIKQFERGINEFAPEGFEQTAFASTADDAIIDAILGEQFSEASDAIMRARDRGTLNDAGFRYAMDNLNTQRAGANSRLQGIGGGILEGYRGELSGIVNNARTGASGFDFGDTFDPDTYRTQLETRQGELSGGLEGAIRNAIGGEQFFNTSDLIQKGGIGQGATNNGANAPALAAALSNRKKQEEEQRGLGTQGSF